MRLTRAEMVAVLPGFEPCGRDTDVAITSLALELRPEWWAAGLADPDEAQQNSCNNWRGFHIEKEQTPRSMSS